MDVEGIVIDPHVSYNLGVFLEELKKPKRSQW